MSVLETADLAERFVLARTNRSPIGVLSREVSLTDEQAYAVQHRFVELWCAAKGTEVRGYKVSLTNDEAQAGLNTSEPTCGALLSETLVDSPAVIDLADFNGMLIEPELVFLLDEDLSADPGHDEIAGACRVAAGLELPESRYVDWYPDGGIQVADLIADNSVAGRLIIGDAVPASSVDLAAVPMETRLDGEVVLTGDSSAVLGHPAASLAWLARKLAGRGEKLARGMVVTSGTFTPPLVAAPGNVEADFGGVGRVQVSFR